MCEYPGWVPEAFHARFPVSVSLKKWPARKASPLVTSAFGRQNEAPSRTRETTSGTQGNVWTEAPFGQMKSEKAKRKVTNLAKTRLNLNHESLQLSKLVSFYGVIMYTFSTSC